MFQDQLPFRRAGPLLAAGLCFLAGGGCQGAKKRQMMGPINFEEQMQTVAEEQNIAREFDKRADRYGGFRKYEYTNGVIHAKRVVKDKKTQDLEKTYADGVLIRFHNARFRGLLHDFDSAKLMSDRAFVRFRQTQDGEELVLVRASGHVDFLSDRGHRAQDEKIEIDLRHGAFLSGGFIRAVLTPEPELPLPSR